MLRSVRRYSPAQPHTSPYIRPCSRLSQSSSVTDSGRSRLRERNSHDMALLMFSASARFSSALVRTGRSSPCCSASVSGVAPAGSAARSVTGGSRPESATLQQLLGELLLKLRGRRGCLVFQEHCLVHGRDLGMRQLPCSLADDGPEFASRHEQVHQVAAEG